MNSNGNNLNFVMEELDPLSAIGNTRRRLLGGM